MPFVKNDPRINREGRPVGSKNFETDFDEAVSELAKENGMTRSEARKLLLKVAFKQAKDGNYSFYKDIHDRIYGQPKSTNDVNVGGELIAKVILLPERTNETNNIVASESRETDPSLASQPN